MWHLIDFRIKWHSRQHLNLRHSIALYHFPPYLRKRRKKDNLDVVLGSFDPPTSNSGSLAPFDCSGEVAQVHWELIQRATCHMAQCKPARGGRPGGALRISFQPLQSKTVGQSDDGLRGALRLLVVLIPFPSSVSGLGSPLRSVLNHDYGLLNILFRTPLSLTCVFFRHVRVFSSQNYIQSCFRNLHATRGAPWTSERVVAGRENGCRREQSAGSCARTQTRRR